MAINSNPVTMLVVDDEPEMKPLFELRFHKKVETGEFNFIYAMSGEEALQLLEQDPPIDIALCDINMPGMDGLTLLPKLLAYSDLLRVVMVSAYGDMKNIRKAMNLGAYDFVTKPIDFKDLETTIYKTLKDVEISKRARITRELEEKNKSLRELDQAKSRFFTNISHEFRTPLTAILGAADQIKLDPDHWLEKGIPVIERNGKNLLGLVNQVLDLRQLESGKLSLQLIQSDIIAFIHYLLESFHSLLEQKSLRLNIENSVDILMMDFDPDKLTSILTNLLSNAIKYTPKGGHVSVQINQIEEHLQIKVRDSGIGIPQKNLARVFDRYFRAPELMDEGGSGVGLALTKELVALFNGNISVESKEGLGSTFTLLLPVTQKAEIVNARRFIQERVSDSGPDDPLADQDAIQERPTLLIVEDNVDVAQYLCGCLEDDYLVEIAWDGQEGIDRAIEQVPDIIISDVIMPGKSGYDLCNTLKSDRRTSHIPIVLLTARADSESRIEGFEKGADAYLTKPFNRQELFVRLGKLLEIRKKLQEYYSAVENISAAINHGENPETTFLWNVKKAIEDNIDDEHFGIRELCRTVGVSRAQLHRKIKALTNYSTSIFIRSIRLNKAKILLQTTDLNISQIAYEVGFADPGYFSIKFHEYFGQRAKDVRK